MGFSLPEFKALMPPAEIFREGRTLCVAVSGGPDSMALCWMLLSWAKDHDFSVHAYTVDHGLRSEAASEAAMVAATVAAWKAQGYDIAHDILRWEGEKPQARLLEEARAARYALIFSAMAGRGQKYLFVAHHQDDQAETFLMRLAKGSGLDGLAGMADCQRMENGIMLLRPLLDVGKEDLVLICRDNHIAYADDPTNKNEEYLRPRLRGAQDVLAREGLSAKRLSVTARRLMRARRALETMAAGLFESCLLEQREDGFLLDIKKLSAAPEELVLRVMLTAMAKLRPGADYAPRLERAEDLCERILRDADFRGATLGGCVFAKKAGRETLWIGKEG